jgi:hypothetical protein
MGSEFASDGFSSSSVFAGSDRLRLGFGLVAGFSLSKLLNISVADLQALLIAGLAMLLIGLGVFLCT